MRSINQAQLESIARLLAAAGFALTVSACSVGNMFGGTEAGSDAQLQNANASQIDIVANQATALPAIATECPPIKVRPGGEALFSYGSGKVGNPHDLQFQAVIDKQSRNCVVSNGLITVKMGVVGRLLLGPAGNISSATLPLRFAVERDDATLFSEKYDIPVTVTPPSQSEEFVKVLENVAIPYIGGENLIIWVGFDTK